MKIHQLPDGARFEYEGEEYVKTGPLFGTGKAGPRLIPRHAVLKPLDAVAVAAEKTANADLPRARVLEAFAGFYARCSALVSAEGRAALDAARAEFFKNLDR